MAFTEEEQQRYRKGGYPSYRYRMSASTFMEQIRAVAEYEAREHAKLVAEGWVWDAATRQYTHPDHPDTIILF